MMKLDEVQQIGQGSLININWELVSHCQFKCTYCYYGPFKSTTSYTPLSKIVLKKLSSITESTKITLLGGEPTLHPDFHYVVSELFKMEHVKKINIVTNFEMPLEFWEKIIPYKNKVKVVVSFHPEYPQKDAFHKIQKLQDFLDFDLVFVVHHNLKFLKRLIEYKENILSHVKDQVPFTFVRVHQNSNGQNEYVSYPEEIESFLKEINELTVKRNNFEKAFILVNDQWQIVPKFEIINQGLNKLKGWKCDLRAFIIHEDGSTTSSCTSTKKHILLQDFSQKTLTCPYNICECDDYWDFPKKPS